MTVKGTAPTPAGTINLPARVTISRVIQPDGLIHGDCPQRHCVVPVLESLCSVNPPQLQVITGEDIAGGL